MNLEELWLDTIKIGNEVRKKKWDGQKEWQPLKEKYGNYYFKKPNDKIKIKDSFKNIKDKTKYKVKKKDKEHQKVKLVVNGSELDNTKEIHHFFIQHFRIPIMGDFELPIIKILQIAYNAGQFEAERENNTYSDEVTNFYDENALGRLDTYVNTEKSIKVKTSKDKELDKVKELSREWIGGYKTSFRGDDDEGSGCGCGSLKLNGGYKTSFRGDDDGSGCGCGSLKLNGGYKTSFKGDDEGPGCGCGSLKLKGGSKDLILGNNNKAYLYQRKYIKYKTKYLSMKY